MSYLNETQCRTILQTPHFTQPFTVSFIDYILYRGQTNVSVLTIRFTRFQPTDYNTVLSTLRHELMLYFALNTPLVYSVDYDVLLSAPLPDGTLSYYIWRANSNRHQFNSHTEATFTLTHSNIQELVDFILQDHLAQAVIDFGNSKVSVVRVLAVVVSFMPVGQ